MRNEEIVELIRKNPEQRQELIYELYTDNRPLIVKTVRPFANDNDFEDLMHEVYFGLNDAVDRYDSSQGVKFITYALFWIRRSIFSYLQSSGKIRLPAEVWSKVGAYKRYVSTYYLENGRYPTREECARELDISSKNLDYIIMQSKPISSLDEETETEDGTLSILDVLPSTEDVENDSIERIYSEYANTEIWKICESGLSTERERYLFNAKYKQNRSNVDIAKEMGITHSRVGQLNASLLRRLRCGKVKAELRRRLYIDDSTSYSGSLSAYKQHDFTSVVERRVLNRERIKEQMKEKYGDILDVQYL